MLEGSGLGSDQGGYLKSGGVPPRGVFITYWTRTLIDTDIFVRIVASMSVCRPFSLPQLAVSCGSAARLSDPDTHEL